MKELLQLGSWERFFRPVLGVSLCHPLVGRSAHSGVGSTFCCLRFWRGLCVCPFSQRRSGSWPFFFLLPLALPWGLVCFGSLAVMLFTWAFPCVGLPRMGGLLVALPEVRLPGMGCWCPFRVPQILCLTPLPRVRSWLLVSGIAVRALLLATSLPLGMDVSLAPGRCLSVSTFYGWFSILKVLVLKCRVLPFS